MFKEVKMHKYAIIGGTALKTMESLSTEHIKNEYGLCEYKVLNDETIFLPRHGLNYSVPPTFINYRANIKTLKDLGVEYAYAINSVGSLKEEIEPLTIVLATDFLDFTKKRDYTFFTGLEKGVKFISMDEPYSLEMNKLFLEKYEGKITSGVLVATEGPKFETKIENKFYKSIGGDVVGMTGSPEVILANELGIKYASINVVANYGTGVSSKEVTITDEQEIVALKAAHICLEIFENGLNFNDGARFL